MSQPQQPARRALRMRWIIPALALFALAISLYGASADVLWSLRAPRVLAGFSVGALLALSGLAMQVLLRNPLADPYVLGTSGGAALGAIAALLAGGLLWLGAALGALVAGLLLLWLAHGAWMGALNAREDDASSRLILAGAMLGAVFGAAATLLLTLAPDEGLRGAIFWLVGDLSGAGDARWAFLLALVLVAYYAFRARAIDRLMLGMEAAWLLGEPVRRLRHELLLLACLATASAVSIAGAIGFVGLVVPQALRLSGVRSTRQLAWMSALGGGTLLILADALARNVAWPLELPVGAVMSLIGAPLFIVFLARGAR
jgi:iron complex transport system permease protein